MLSYVGSLQSIRIPKWLGFSPGEASAIEIHGFTDASSKVYGAVIYLRVIIENRVLVTLQCSKIRVAPTKPISILRLELRAAYLLAKLPNRYYSQCRIRRRPFICGQILRTSRWQTFVGNPCSAIQTLTLQAF